MAKGDNVPASDSDSTLSGAFRMGYWGSIFGKMHRLWQKRKPEAYTNEFFQSGPKGALQDPMGPHGNDTK